mmetsp:Transcript_21783/g.40013  ORF Transcript_21783/g.40013 Transcript_21783/m.40013 type:complete len:123 (+) Transcript_21783:321-689(+)
MIQSQRVKTKTDSDIILIEQLLIREKTNRETLPQAKTVQPIDTVKGSSSKKQLNIIVEAPLSNTQYDAMQLYRSSYPGRTELQNIGWAKKSPWSSSKRIIPRGISCSKSGATTVPDTSQFNH